MVCGIAFLVGPVWQPAVPGPSHSVLLLLSSSMNTVDRERQKRERVPLEWCSGIVLTVRFRSERCLLLFTLKFWIIWKRCDLSSQHCRERERERVRGGIQLHLLEPEVQLTRPSFVWDDASSCFFSLKVCKVNSCHIQCITNAFQMT